MLTALGAISSTNAENIVVGVNVVGMRRLGIPTANIDAVRRAFHVLYRDGYSVPAALKRAVSIGC